MVTRSVFIAPDGLPLAQFGSYDPDHRTLFRQRWGGWYVTGTHGSMRHMGNAIVTNVNERDSMISERTLNRTSLDGLFDPSGYPSAHSDIAALMVFQDGEGMKSDKGRWRVPIVRTRHELRCGRRVCPRGQRS